MVAFIIDRLFESTYFGSFYAEWQKFLGLSPPVVLLKFGDVETILIYLGFEVGPKKSHGDKSDKRIKSQGDNMPRNHFSWNRE